MKFFGSRHRTHRRQPSLAVVPAGSGNAAAPARFADPIAQAMRTGDRRGADAIWFGGITYRADSGSSR
jgi:hypothetical protein